LRPEHAGEVEHFERRFDREFSLPRGIDADSIQVMSRRGVPTVTIPAKAEVEDDHGADREVALRPTAGIAAAVGTTRKSC
jgi:HSP20 family molecular chaperone IbpA